MYYSLMRETDVKEIAELYMTYYNDHESGCWKYETAYKRVHQMVTIEDSLCLIQRDTHQNITGFVLGYFKKYDDISSYYLEEIVILAPYQNKGYGKQFLCQIEKLVLEHGVRHMELTSVNDAHHIHFYERLGMYPATNLRIMAKHYE